jgi:hypothetical protein
MVLINDFNIYPKNPGATICSFLRRQGPPKAVLARQLFSASTGYQQKDHAAAMVFFPIFGPLPGHG